SDFGLWIESELPRVVLSIGSRNTRVKVNCVRRQSIGKFRHKALHASFRSQEKAVAGAAGRAVGMGATECGVKQAAVSAFEFDELGNGSSHAEFFGVGSINPGDQRLYKTFEHLAAETAASERSNALIGLRFQVMRCNWSARNERFGE